MYSSTSNDEVIIKLVGRLSIEFPSIDQLKVRSIAEEVLYKYNVLPKETALVASDAEEKVQLYLTVKKMDGLSMKTLTNYKYNLAIFSDYMRKPLATIDDMDIRIFLKQRCEKMKADSVNNQIYILKSFFKWLYDEEYIIKNPMNKIKCTKEPKRLRHALTDEELELLRQACITDRERAVLELYASSGCRLSEIIKLNKDDLDWHERSFYVIGKGDKERKAFFSVKAKVLLKKYIKSREDANPALFVGIKNPHGRIGGRAIEKEITRIAHRAGFQKSVFPHLMRHTFATHNINAGMPLHILQKLMGHSSADTTLGYAEISDENVAHEYRRVS